MSLRFWTSLQALFQAVLVEDKRIIKSIPDHPPQTIFRRKWAVGEYDGDKLAIVKHAAFELWSRDGSQCFRSFHHPLIYQPHEVVQYGKDVLICSTGLEMFFLMDIDGNVKWEWWGYKNDLGEKNTAYFQEDWVVNQTTTEDNTAINTTKCAHFNSIYLMGDKFLTVSLRLGKIVEITIGQDGFKLVADIKQSGAHSAISHNGVLVYGTFGGIMAGEKLVLPEYGWVKAVRAFEDGFVFTHMKGLAVTDANWQVKENVLLPAPFKFAYLERFQ